MNVREAKAMFRRWHSYADELVQLEIDLKFAKHLRNALWQAQTEHLIATYDPFTGVYP